MLPMWKRTGLETLTVNRFPYFLCWRWGERERERGRERERSKRVTE